MASPQLEKGFTRIANELLEQLSMPGMNGSELRVVLFIVRKTYGFGKLSDRISLSQFQLGTGMNRAQAVETIKDLLAKKIIVKTGGVYKLNKDYDEWVVCKRIPPVASMQKHTTASMQKHTSTSMQKHTHKRKKETITKETTCKSELLPFSWADYLQKMEDDRRRHIQVIAFFFKEKGIMFDSEEKVKTAIKRHLRSAVDLSPFSDEEINLAVAQAKNEYESLWTIETLVKVLTR